MGALSALSQEIPIVRKNHQLTIILALTGVAVVGLVIALLSDESERTTSPGRPVATAPPVQERGRDAQAPAPDLQGDTSTLLTEGRNLIIGGQAAEALQHFQAVLAREPNNYEAAINAGEALVMLDRAQECLTLLQPMLPNAPTSFRAGMLMAMARAQRSLENRTAAMGLMEEAIELQPGDPVMLNNYAALLMETGANEAALETLQRALAANPMNADDVLDNIWRVQFQLGRIEAAEATLDRMTREFGHQPKAWVRQGIFFGRTGRYQDALNALNKALEIDPRHADAIFNLALVFGRMEDFQQMEIQLERFLTLRPGHAQGESLLREVQERIASGE